MNAVVYLCGGINGLSDADAKDWRELAKQRLPNTLDPMRRDYRGREAESFDEIIRRDRQDIDECEVVLAMCPSPSWGTAMEIFYAWTINRPVFAVVPDVDAASPWLRYHAKLYPSLDAAIDEIQRLCW